MAFIYKLQSFTEKIIGKLIDITGMELIFGMNVFFFWYVDQKI